MRRDIQREDQHHVSVRQRFAFFDSGHSCRRLRCPSAHPTSVLMRDWLFVDVMQIFQAGLPPSDDTDMYVCGRARGEDSCGAAIKYEAARGQRGGGFLLAVQWGGAEEGVQDVAGDGRARGGAGPFCCLGMVDIYERGITRIF